jgi:hypothetical protein
MPQPKLAEDVGSALPVRSVTADVAALALRVQRQHEIVDARLDRPQRWRGQLRRQIHSYGRADDVTRYRRAYDELITIASVPGWTLDAKALRHIHDAAVGGSAFRSIGLTVGGDHDLPAPSVVPDMIDEALELAAGSNEPIAVAAARLHLKLLSVHPFVDGNGRTARLAATMWLVHHGFRSTLLTAVEQHFHSTPTRYIAVLDEYRYHEISEDACVACLVEAMAANAMYAAWFRAREIRLRARCAALGIPASVITQVLVAYDLGGPQSTEAAALADTVVGEEVSFRSLSERLTVDQRTEFAFQVGVLLEEERDA